MFATVKRLASRLFGRKEASFSTATGGVPIFKFTDYQSYLDAGTGKVWASFKACDLTATTVQETSWGLKNEKGEAVENKLIEELLRKPNENMTWREILYLTVQHFKMTGNAFWYKSEANIGGDRPTELIPLNLRT